MKDIIKKSMRMSHAKLDEVIQNDIDTCLLDLKIHGIIASKLKPDTSDKLIQKACELYCKGQFDFLGKGEQFSNAYEGLRDCLMLSDEYIVEGVTDAK